MSGPCQSCVVTVINGFRCHERGCPDAWRDSTRSCKECGTTFRPTERLQEHCGQECKEAYYGRS